MSKLFLFCIILLLPVAALAHGDSPSFEKEIPPYLIDIGYDRIGMRPGEEVTFDIDLFTQSGAVAFATFTHVDIEIADANAVTVLDTTLENDAVNVPILKHTFADEGMHTLHVTYRNGGDQLAYATFDMPVGAGNGSVGRVMNVGTYIVAIVMVGIAGYVIVASFRKKKPLQ